MPTNRNHPPKIKVLIAEDHAVVRQGLKILIHSDPDFQVSAEAEDGEQAVELAQAVEPDVVVMDVAMPQMDGVKATRLIKDRLPGSKILVLSSYGDDDSVRSLLEAGASGYITKHSASDDLLEGIRRVHEGKSYFSPRIAKRLKRRTDTQFLNGNHFSGRMTERELQVLRMIAQGLATRDIAGELKLSVKTVEKHRQSLMHKLDIHEIAGLTRYAAAKGLIKGA